MELKSFAEVAQIVIAAASLVALAFTLRELRQTRLHQRENTQVSRKRIVTEILLSVWGAEDERSFFYRLDYEDWTFSPDRFRKTNEERLLDQILYKAALLGNLLKSDSIDAEDIQQAEFFVFTVLGNDQVYEYLKWAQRDVPLGVSFTDAYGIFLHFCKVRAARARAREAAGTSIESHVDDLKMRETRILDLIPNGTTRWWG